MENIRETNGKLEITDVMCDRIKDLQKKSGKRDKEIAGRLSIKYEQYKNIKNGRIKKIDILLFISICECFNCTEDYLLGKSPLPTENAFGLTIRRPIKNDLEDKLMNINNYLRADYDLLNGLYFLINDIPYNERDKILEGFLASISILKKYSFINLKDKDRVKQLNHLIDDQMYLYDDKYTYLMLNLFEADSLLSKKRRKDALEKYIWILYNHHLPALDIIKSAASKIRFLKNTWGQFPSELVPLVDQIESSREFPTVQLPNTWKKIIENYNPNIKKSDQ